MNRTLLKKIKKADWDCVDQDTQYLTHSIHRYSGKYIPQIARNAIELLTMPGDLILDPYCGSGTTLLEASLLGRRSVGVDINPLAVLISKVKVTKIAKKKLDSFRDEMLAQLLPLLGKTSQLSLFTKQTISEKGISESVKKDSRWSDAWYQKWFQEDRRYELIWIHQRLTQIKDRNMRNIGLVTFSDVLRRSSNAHSSYPNVMFDRNKKAVPPVAPQFIARMDEIISAVSKLESSMIDKPVPIILQGNARNLSFNDNTFDAIVTHPPYIGSIPYAEYGMLSLVWLGHDPKSLDKELTGGKRQTQDVVKRFEEGYSDMLKEAHRTLRKGGYLFILIGSPIVKGETIDLINMTEEFCKIIGFNFSAKHFRNSINRRANLMGSECLLFFQKTN